jgi:choline-sulfatase
MLGERGMWFKMCLFERAMRVPLILRLPPALRKPGRVARNVSHLDLLPTLLDLACGGKPQPLVEPIDGQSLAPLLEQGGDVPERDVFAEYTAEGAIAPCFMVRSGRHKYIWSEPDGGQLFDLARDPHEIDNLAGKAASAELEESMLRKVHTRWNVAAVERDVLTSQRRRLFLQPVLTFANSHGWDYQPFRDASLEYVRGKTATNAKALSRIPYADPVPPDHPRGSPAND